MSISPYGLLLIASLLGENPPQAEPSDNPVLSIAADDFITRSDFAFGQEIEGFTRGELHRYESAAEGMSLNFISRSHPELNSDVYIYPAGRYTDPDRALAAGATDLLQGVRAAAARRIYSLKSEPVASTGVQVIGGQRRSYAALTFEFSNDKGTFASMAKVFYQQFYFIKFRSSFPSNGNQSFNQEAERLVELFMPMARIRSFGRCGHGFVIHQAKDEAGDGHVSDDGYDLYLKDAKNEKAFVDLLKEAARRQTDAGCIVDDFYKRFGGDKPDSKKDR